MKRAGVTAEEAFAEYFFQCAEWSSREHQFSNIDQFSVGERAANEGAARYVYGTAPISRLWYETSKVGLNADIVRYIDNLLAQPS